MGVNDSLLFDGTDDFITLDAGDLLNVGLDAHSIFAIVKRGNDTSFDGIVYGGDSGGNGKAGISIRADDFLLIDCNTIDGICEDAGAGSATSTIEADAAFGWMILGYTKAAGSAATPVFHRYRYDTDTWSHENGDQPLNELRNALNEFFIGAWMDTGAGNDFFVGNILVVSIWTSDLGDGSAVEAFFDGIEASRAGWAGTGPAEMITCNSMSALNSDTGTMGEVGRTGTSLDTDDVPAGWDGNLNPPTTGTPASLGMWHPHLRDAAWF